MASGFVLRILAGQDSHISPSTADLTAADLVPDGTMQNILAADIRAGTVRVRAKEGTSSIVLKQPSWTCYMAILPYPHEDNVRGIFHEQS